MGDAQSATRLHQIASAQPRLHQSKLIRLDYFHIRCYRAINIVDFNDDILVVEFRLREKIKRTENKNKIKVIGLFH